MSTAAANGTIATKISTPTTLVTMSDIFDRSGFGVAATELLEAVRAIDGRAPDGPPDPSAVSTLLTEYDGPVGSTPGQLVALAWRPTEQDPAELYVHPDFRRRGVGRRLAERILAEPRSATAAPGPHPTPGIWAHGTLPAAASLAESLGLSPRRELLQMRAPLPVAEGAMPRRAPVPEGAVIRTFVPGADDAEFLRVNAAAFAWHPEQGRLSQADLDAEKSADWFDPLGFFLAVEQERPEVVLGFHWTKVHPAQPPKEPEPLGEIYVLGVDPGSPVRHLGTPLTTAGLDYLAARGLRRALLYVESDNTRAVDLYRRFGFDIHAVDTVFS